MSPTIPQSVSVTGYGTAQEEATQHNAYVDENSTDDQTSIVQQSSNKRRSYITLAILLAINLLNYADRFTIAGMLTDIQKYYGATNVEGGLFNTVFICAFMIFAPLFGYWGDRFPRKPIMILGISIWVAAVAAATFVPATTDNPRKFLWLFMLFRAIVGIGEASYSTVAPTIIADMFTHDQRSRALMLFYFAIPIGTGMGFIVSSKVASISSWQWGMRTTPIVGVILILVMIFILQEPMREGHTHTTPKSGYIDDVRAIVKVKTYVFSTIGYTGIVFVTGGMGFWTPTAMRYAYGIKNPDAGDDVLSNITTIFGVIAVLTGFFGVIIGGFWAQIWRRTNPRADPLVCGISALTGVPFIFFALTTVERSLYAGYFFVFFGMLFLCFNWSVTSDIVMYTMIPSRRATAMSLQILCSHLFGDAISSLLVGGISDAIRGADDSNAGHFHSLQYALYLPNFILVFGGFFFMCSGWFVEADRARCQNAIALAKLMPCDVEDGAIEGYSPTNGRGATSYTNQAMQNSDN